MSNSQTPEQQQGSTTHNMRQYLWLTRTSRLRASRIFPAPTSNTSGCTNFEIAYQMITVCLRSMVSVYSTLQASNIFVTQYSKSSGGNSEGMDPRSMCPSQQTIEIYSDLRAFRSSRTLILYASVLLDYQISYNTHVSPRL
jgi:hypothetical protein